MDRIIEKKKGLRKKHIPYILLGLFVLVLLLWAIFGNHASTIKVDAHNGQVIMKNFWDGVYVD